MTLDDWIRAHEFLRPLAQVCAAIDSAVASETPWQASPIDWAGYVADFTAGIPLLRSQAAAVNLSPAGEVVVRVVGRLAAARLAGDVGADATALAAWLAKTPEVASRIVDWLLGDEGWEPPQAGLLRSVGWLTLTASLRPLLNTFAAWRDENRWMRRYCPACGSLPAMAQLVGADPGRQRFLCCGCCADRWRYGRTLCPFCETASHKLVSVTAEGEHDLRIDHCESCGAYLKTYAGQGSEGVLLADWTSLHLDLAARDRGWRPMAASLYDFPTPQNVAPTVFRSGPDRSEEATRH